MSEPDEQKKEETLLEKRMAILLQLVNQLEETVRNLNHKFTFVMLAFVMMCFYLMFVFSWIQLYLKGQ